MQDPSVNDSIGGQPDNNPTSYSNPQILARPVGPDELDDVELGLNAESADSAGGSPDVHG